LDTVCASICMAAGRAAFRIRYAIRL
jgi:hypothetical protein